MTVDEMELVRRLGEVEPLPPAVAARSEVVLRATMALARAEQHAPRAGTPPPVHRAPAPHPQRSPKRAWRALIGAAAAATAAGGTGALLAAGHSAPASPRTPAATPGRTDAVTAAYVLGRLRLALDANTAILVTRSQAPDSVTGKPVTTETWTSAASDTSRTEVLDAAGDPVSGYLLTVSPAGTTAVSIDYAARTWSTRTYPAGSSSASSPAPLAETPAQVAARLEAAAHGGGESLSGPTTIDGETAIGVRQVVPASGGFPAGVIETWIDPRSYLPIREVDTSAGHRLITDYRWLADTPANAQLLTAAAAVPTGFTEVPAP